MLTLILALAATQDLTDETYAKIRDTVMPSKEELKWRDIPWQPSLWDAVVVGQKEDKPLLIWAMNGHPLACT